MFCQNYSFTKENIGVTSQTAVFQRKNKVLARVGVAALNRFFQNYSFAKEKHWFSAKVNPLLRKNIGFQQRLTLSLTLSGLRKPISEMKFRFAF